jgi:hypothetical protein
MDQRLLLLVLLTTAASACLTTLTEASPPPVEAFVAFVVWALASTALAVLLPRARRGGAE